MENIFEIITSVIGILIMLIFLYQGVYIFIGILKKPKEFKANKLNKFAVVISARNESNVIAHLIDSIKAQTYKEELVHIFVVADNCEDNTAEIARGAGAIVYERFDYTHIGKGYALNYLFGQIDTDYGIDSFDGFFVFDADNILEKDYIEEMNHVFDNGFNVVTSYRNSKNYGSNWISAGYSLWFLREAKFINNARMLLGNSCAVSGTGFLIHKDIIKKNQGWKHFLLTEDIQFSVDNILDGEKIGYCGKAMLYDEQPIRFIDSWNQRMRWSKGFYQVFFRYGKELIKKAFVNKDFSCYDMFITLMPGVGMMLLTGILGLASIISSVVNGSSIIDLLVKALSISVLNTYLTFFALAVVTTISEWKRIYCKNYLKIIYIFTFPIFMFTYIPISVIALFKKPQWKPIPHSVVVTAANIRGQS